MKSEIKGLSKLRKALNDINKHYEKAAKAALEQTAKKIVSDAKSNAPVATGALRNSIHYIIFADGTRVEIGSDLDYASAVEFGTQSQAAQPFIFPAIESNRDLFEKLIKRQVK